MADDDTSIPLCHFHHIGDFHNLTGVFRGWKKQKSREWQDEQIAKTRALYKRKRIADPPEADDEIIYLAFVMPVLKKGHEAMLDKRARPDADVWELTEGHYDVRAGVFGKVA